MQVVTKFVKSETANTNSISSRSRVLIKSGLSNAEILETIHKEFPAAKTTMACIAWYKSDMRKKGELPKRGEVVRYFAVDADGIETEMTPQEVQDYLASN